MLAVARRGGVEIITVDHPPVNALSTLVRAHLLAAVEAADADPSVHAMVIECAGRTFFAGADIREFGKPPQPPHLGIVVDRIEACTKPVVAAIHGTALGGGLELAMGCHARVAAPDARVGLPEVTLGLLPGAGGTQRLPRLVGVTEALRLIVEGKPVSASSALALGLVDEIAEDWREAAVAKADALAHALAADAATSDELPTAALRRTRDLPVLAGGAEALFDTEAARLAVRQRGFPAPLKALQAVRAAAELPFAAGIAVERALFEQLLHSPESRALRQVFFAERQAHKPRPPAGVSPRAVATAAVLGAGTMGRGITLCLTEAGVPVTLVDVDAGSLTRGLTAIQSFHDGRVAKGVLGRGQADERVALVRPSTSLEAVAGADLIIEAVFEDLTVKRELFARLDVLAKPGAVLASNTSYLDIDAMAAATRRPADVLGLHFFSPAHIMKLLEVVRGAATSPEVLATGLAVGARLGKYAIAMGNCVGFTGNRMLMQRTREAFFLLEEGATPWQVDEALVNFGFPMGPFAMGDLAGLDIGWRSRRARFAQLSAREQACDILDQLCALERFGQKSGRGFHLYDVDRKATPDPEVEALIERHSARVGRARRVIDSAEILHRCLYAMVNEAARILEEGIVGQACDVDLVWLHGFGFPRYRGGPLFWADQVGAAAILEGIRAFGAAHGTEYWTPAPLLERLAAEGRGFHTDPGTAAATRL